MAKMEKARRKMPRRGLLAESGRTIRLVTGVVLLIACAALAFTQLGFRGIGVEDDYQAYIMILLLPVALAALLLGALRGAAMGVAAGALMFAHAVLMPLDYYELTYVTPFSSVVLLGLSGWLLGLLFAFALRNDPKGVRRIIYIAIVCILVSWFYSIGFVMNVLASTAAALLRDGFASASEAQAKEMVTEKVITMALRMGDVGLQAWIDAALMALFCSLASFGAKRVEERAGDVRLHALFASWLSVVVLVAFMVTAGVSFVSITQGEQIKGTTELKDQVDYLCTQVKIQQSRYKAFGEFTKMLGVAAEDLTDEYSKILAEAVSVGNLLSGYTEIDDGLIVLTSAAAGEPQDSNFENTVVYLSDSDRFETGSPITRYFDKEVIQGVKASLEEGEVTRVVYDEVDYSNDVLDQVEAMKDVRSYVAFLCCEQVDDIYVIAMTPASKVFADRTVTMIWTSLVAFALLLSVFIMVFQLLRRLVVERIDETNSVLVRITGGDLDARVEERNTREFSSLSDGINSTVGTLKGWISEAETRMGAELATAKAIQESALPRTFPPYPDIAKFDVYASMSPAREVGGDFYDFFLIGDDCKAEAGKLGFIIADVSGKGVPAALFMMKSMTLVRDYLKSGMEVGEAIENANRQLVDGNDAGMFVTGWVGVLDYATGHVEFVNAGHNPPLLWQGDSGWRWLTEKSGLPLGLFDGFPYEAYSLECGIGDQFLLYTDGVTEAMSTDDELYGEERLEAFANGNFTLHPRRLVEALRRDVAQFAEGAEQSDDITILALEVGVPPEITTMLVVPADVGELPRVNEFIHSELDRRFCSKRVQNQIDIAVEELFVNVAHYAYPDATPENPGMVRVGCTYSADPPSIKVTIADEGIPYDPMAKPDAVTPDDIADVPIGGLGILMAKRCVDEMSYERVDDSNVVTILKKW